jgi:hypothetical protein
MINDGDASPGERESRIAKGVYYQTEGLTLREWFDGMELFGRVERDESWH